MPTTDPARWNQRYIDGTLPWNTDDPDKHLVARYADLMSTPGRALDIGCGTGTHSVWMATQGAEVTGVDVAPAAIARAQDRAAATQQAARFVVCDIQTQALPAGPYDLVFDRGCFHVFATDAERDRFAQQVASALAPDGHWLSLIGSTEGPDRETGPPRRSLRDISRAVEPHLEIVTIARTTFDDAAHREIAAWVMVARPRL